MKIIKIKFLQFNKKKKENQIRKNKNYQIF